MTRSRARPAGGRSRVRRRHRLRPLQGDVRQHASHRDQLPRPRRRHMFPQTRTVIDMGGQDTKAIRVAPSGEIVDFCMNDKCAAGTGRFLGAARRARHSARPSRPDRAARRARQDQHDVHGLRRVRGALLAREGKKIEDILLGVHQSIAARSVGLLRRVGVEDEVTFTGGVARNLAMVDALNERWGFRSTSARSPTTWARSAPRSSRSTASLSSRIAGRATS